MVRGIKLVGIMMMVLMLSASVSAFSLGDLWSKSSEDWEECTELYSDLYTLEECQEYCTGSDDEAECTYPDEVKRTFEFRMYPVDCTIPEFKLPNPYYTDCDSVTGQCERVMVEADGGQHAGDFSFQVDLDLNSRLNIQQSYDSVKSCGGDSQYLHRNDYEVSPTMVNNVKLIKQWQYDPIGLPYLETPSLGDLKDIYPEYSSDNLKDMLNNFYPKWMGISKYNVLKVTWDCNYQGEDDDTLDGFIDIDNSEIAFTKKQYFDFTESNIFTESIDGVELSDLYNEKLLKDCTWTKYLFNTDDCFSTWRNKRSVEGEILGNTDLEVIPRGSNEKQYQYLTSSKSKFSHGVTCEYGDDSPVRDQDNVTVRVNALIGVSYEHFLLQEDTWGAVSNEWQEDLGLDCDEDSLACPITAEYTFTVNGDGKNATITPIDSSLNGEDVSYEEALDDAYSEFVAPPVPNVEGIFNQIVRDEYEAPNIAKSKVYRDIYQESTFGRMKEVSMYFMSFSILIVYMLELFFIGFAIRLIASSFKEVREAFRKIMDIEELK